MHLPSLPQEPTCCYSWLIDPRADGQAHDWTSCTIHEPREDFCFSLKVVSTVGGSHDVVQTDLRLTKLLPPLPVCCNYRTLRVQDSRVTCQRPKISISFGFLSACSPRDLLRPSPQMGYRERRLKLHSSGQRQHGLSQTWKFLDRDRQSAVLQTQRKRWLPLCL
uniref:Uncharacterized protein n=1 Tax=Mus musculus TaxID=10090 RepID=Q8CC80_MOUSE|nr:unnamed protein product [Mus musculus]